MSARTVLVSLVFLCAALALVAGGYVFHASVSPPNQHRLFNAVVASALIGFGGLLCAVGFGLMRVLRRARRTENMLNRKLETLQLRGDYERGQAEILEKISSLIEVFNRTRDLEAVLFQAVTVLRTILHVDVIVLQVYSDEESRFFTRIEDGAHDVDLGEGIQRDVIALGKSRLVNRLESMSRYDDLLRQGYHSMIVAPLVAKHGSASGAVGLIAALSRSPRDFLSHELTLLTTFASQAGLIIEDAHLFKKTEHLALHDGLLTELFNRRYFMATLEEEIRKASASGSDVALVMVDIDDFKRHNDTYGHLSGDAALRAVANLLLDNTRGLDVVARYGGEEFVVVLHDTDERGAATVAETIRRRVEEHEFITSDGTPARLSVSVGVAVCPRDADGATALIAAADAALYRAKASGKNAVVVAAV